MNFSLTESFICIQRGCLPSRIALSKSFLGSSMGVCCDGFRCGSVAFGGDVFGGDELIICLKGDFPTSPFTRGADFVGPLVTVDGNGGGGGGGGGGGMFAGGEEETGGGGGSSWGGSAAVVIS